MRLRSRILALTAASAAALLAATPVAGAAPAGVTLGPTPYTIGPASLDSVTNGPWTTSQPDAAAGQSQYPTADLFPTYTPTGNSTSNQLANLAAYPGATLGTAPFASGQAGTPGPVDGYCASGGPAPETGAPVAEPTGINEPMAPYYFPFVQRNADGSLTGYFDYRPKDVDEALVSAHSTDGGRSWTVNGQALEENPGNCPDGDTNDNGQGHAFVMGVGATTDVYTLNRVAGDTQGVGLLVHPLTGGENSPLSGLPAAEPVGADPGTTATATTPVPAGANGSTASIPVASLGTAGTPTQLGAGQYIDTTTATPGSYDVITCSGTGSSSLTGCTAPSGEQVTSGDALDAVVASVQSAASVPAGPNNASESGGTTVTLSLPLPTIAAAEEANLGAGRVYLNGHTANCVGDTVGTSTLTLTGCTSPSGAFTTAAGDPVTLDPIVPATAQMTSGLIAPDGIVGTVPSYPGAPSGVTTVLYGEKLLGYYAPTTTTSAFSLPASGSTVSIPVASLGFLSSPQYQQLSGFTPSGGTPTTFSFGDASSSTSFASVTCTGYTASPAALTGCSTTGGNSGDSIASGSSVAIPGAALVAPGVLGQIGEGNTKAKSLYKNNEDYTVLRAAYTTDGVNFSSAGLANGGLISGTDPANDINNPAATASPSATSPYDNPAGATEPTELRFTGTRGSIIQNGDGSETMFLSGAWATDGDSDAFNQIFETTSTDGQHWSTPTTVVSTDYTFSARGNQDAALSATGSDQPLNVSGYYSGRAYSPAAVKNPDGSITLVMSGYSTPKPLPTVGTSLGTGATPWKVTPADPALYRDILTLNLTPQPPAATPEVPLTYVLPVLAAGLLGVGALVERRRRRRA